MVYDNTNALHFYSKCKVPIRGRNNLTLGFFVSVYVCKYIDNSCEDCKSLSICHVFAHTHKYVLFQMCDPSRF